MGVIKDSPKLTHIAHADSSPYLKRLILNIFQNLMKRINFAHLSKFSLLHFLHNFSEKQWPYSSFSAFFTEIISIAFDTKPATSRAEKKKNNKELAFDPLLM